MRHAQIIFRNQAFVCVRLFDQFAAELGWRPVVQGAGASWPVWCVGGVALDYLKMSIDADHFG